MQLFKVLRGVNKIWKDELIDFSKIGIPSAATVWAYFSGWDWFNFLEGAGIAIIILINIAIALVKLIKVYRELQWAKQDRE